jgi:DNA-binding NarL/FixJ family response regulator
LVRAGLRALFERIEGVTVIGEAADGREAVRQAEELRPELVSLDIAMPGLSGLDAAVLLARQGLRVMIVSMYLNEEYILQALQAGATAYLPKDVDPDELAKAVATVRTGGVYLPPRASQLLATYLQRTGERARAASALTGRQRQVLQLIAEGQNTKGIALLLGVGIKTVETHRAALMRRLNIHDVAGLVRYALRHGVIRPEA